MYSGFPTSLLSLLLCTYDGGFLGIVGKSSYASDGHIVNGILRCKLCCREYRINDGVVCLLDDKLMDEESSHERRLRDEQAKGSGSYSLSEQLHKMNVMEISPTLDDLQLSSDQVMLELGCGTGRYTLAIMNACQIKMFLAVDFSLASLRVLAQKLSPQWPVGLVQADIARLTVARQSFNRVLSTLVSNLPTRERRLRMFQLVSDALKVNGRFVFSTHYYNLRDRMENTPKAGRYTEGGIFRYYFKRYEIEHEVQYCFRKFCVRPIQIVIPFAQRLGLPIIALSRIFERLPFVNELGQLLLVTAEEPIRSAELN